MKPVLAVCWLPAALLDAGACAARARDALEPAGPQAAHLAALWDLMLAVSAVVLLAVIVAVLAAIARGRRADAATPPDIAALERDERPLQWAVTSAAALTVAVLLFLLGASLAANRALARLPPGNPLRVELTGHQWWWEAVYLDPVPARVFTTANELHLPADRSVELTLRASDVIHSLWLPNLHGKKDLIPGRSARFVLRAGAPGVYHGQCAEFCGYQHARMGLRVVVEPAAEYERWAARQRRPAPAPDDAHTRRGLEVFLETSCAMCHAINGTPAYGRTAPDLTHFAARATLAAGALPNTPANRAAWIADPQLIKPGANMPAHALPAADLEALVAYLGILR